MEVEEAFNYGSKLNVEHMDVIRLKFTEATWALRAYSADVKREVSELICVRLLIEGCWGIASEMPWGRLNIKKLVKRAFHSARAALLKPGIRVTRYAMTSPVRSRIVHPCRFSLGDVDDQDIMEVLLNIKQGIEEGVHVPHCELIADHMLMEREYWDMNGSHIVEVKPLTDLIAYLNIRGRQVSTIRGGGMGLEFLLRGDQEPLIKKLIRRCRALEKVKRMNPLIRGSKYPIVLSGEVACVLFHECIGHLHEGDRFLMAHQRLPFGARISGEELTIYDDPTIPYCFGSYAYDDEGVKGRRKVLVDSGRIVGFLLSRTSAGFYGLEPTGNGRGALNVPRSLMSNLYVKPGDWRLEEMIEETKEGFFVDGVVMGTMDSYGNCMLEVESAWYIRKGEVVSPVEPIRIQGPAIALLRSIEGLGRELHMRPSFEKGEPISEITPPVKLSRARIYW